MSELSTNRIDPAAIQQGYLLALTDPKRKLTNRQRKYAKHMRSRWANSVRNRQQPKDQSTRLVEKLAKLSARRLVRVIKQTARRAASAKYLLADLHKDSVFRGPLEEQQKSNLIAFVAANTELSNRGTSA